MSTNKNKSKNKNKNSNMNSDNIFVQEVSSKLLFKEGLPKNIIKFNEGIREIFNEADVVVFSGTKGQATYLSELILNSDQSGDPFYDFDLFDLGLNNVSTTLDKNTLVIFKYNKEGLFNKYEYFYGAFYQVVPFIGGSTSIKEVSDRMREEDSSPRFWGVFDNTLYHVYPSEVINYKEFSYVDCTRITVQKIAEKIENLSKKSEICYENYWKNF